MLNDMNVDEMGLLDSISWQPDITFFIGTSSLDWVIEEEKAPVPPIQFPQKHSLV